MTEEEAIRRLDQHDKAEEARLDRFMEKERPKFESHVAEMGPFETLRLIKYMRKGLISDEQAELPANEIEWRDRWRAQWMIAHIYIEAARKRWPTIFRDAPKYWPEHFPSEHA